MRLNTDDVWSGLVHSKFVTAIDTFRKFVDSGESEPPDSDEASSDDAIIAELRSRAEVATDDKSSRTAKMTLTRRQKQISLAKTR